MKDKVIVVTGGSGLIGREIIGHLQKKGAIAINGDLSPASGGGDFMAIDITDEKSVTSFIAAVIDKYGKLDGWVNNAYPRTADWGNKLENIPFESWRKNVDMHLNGYFICCKHVLHQMMTQNNGSLVNMASIYGVVGPDFSVYEGTSMTMPAAYAAIKGGITNLTRYLASYAGPRNVRVNAVSPGGIKDNQPGTFIDRYESKVPLRRMGNPADIAPAITFLLSDEASYITGHNLVIDGGWTAI